MQNFFEYKRNNIMILAIDVDYRENNYDVIAGVIFNNWQDKEPINTI